MKFTIKTLILLTLLAVVFGFFLRLADLNEYEILKPEVVSYDSERSSWGIIMDVKKETFKNIEKNWQKKHTYERK
ncbi:MAG: hypothetical protein KBF99_08790 [Leptospiraceae bacterium]|nr:hypothetical protein [Leptospiraceae bacterium]MBK9498103.1 hypothetical protein [Leptospiraceae bacterium]MBP9163267.1 hypothetical protein [Leptospiraceae bacterium]